MTEQDVEREHLEQHDRAREYDDNDRCTGCGEHIADPHAPNCPRVAEAEVEQIDRIIDTSMRVGPVRTERQRAAIALARQQYVAASDGDVSIHDDADVDDVDSGLWVEAWVWIDNSDLE